MDAGVERGARVYLRSVSPGDRAEWCALRHASAEHLDPWEPIPHDGLSAHDDRAFSRVLHQTDTPSTRRLLICRRDDEVILGMVNLSQICRGPFENGTMGYWIGAAHAGQGYAREGVHLALRHAFGSFELHRVEANVMPKNTRSLRLVRALGFREEGFSPRYLRIAGVWADHLRFAMTAEDWEDGTESEREG